MGKFRSIDRSPGWQVRRLRDLERQLREANAAKRLASSSTPTDGNTLINGLLAILGSLDLTGTLSMKSVDGVELFRLGDMTFGRGISMVRDDSTDALTFRRPFANSTAQLWELRDRNGTSIVAENAVGPGLGKPLLEHPFQPVASTGGTAVTCGPYGWERATTSATFQTLFAYDGKVQNPFIDFKFATRASDTTTAGEIQIVDLVTGTPLLGFLSAAAWVGSIPAGTTSVQLVDPTPDQVATPMSTYGVGGQMRIGVQARRTTGTGTITVSVAQAIGG